MVLRTCVLTVGLTLVVAESGAVAASAATFYVNGGVAASGDCLSAANPCKTINEAVIKARLAGGTPTIDVASGNYTEDLSFTEEADTGLTINGAGSGTSGGTTITGLVEKKPTIEASILDYGPLTLNNLRIVNPTGDEEPAVTTAYTPLALKNVAIDMQSSASSAVAVENHSPAPRSTN